MATLYPAAVFEVYEDILAGLRATLTDWNVYDGYPVGHDPSDFVAVGVDDPWSTTDATAVDADLDWAHAAGRAVDEVGTVNLVLVASDGSGEPAIPRARIRTAAAAVDAWLRQTQQPMQATPRVWQAKITRVRLGHDQTAEEGALCACLLVITYKARI